MRKKILIFQWFNCKDENRKQELIECINHNLKIGFDEIIIHNDSIEPFFYGENIRNISTNTRITYRDYIKVVNDPENYGALVVLTNTDIKIDKKILIFEASIKEKILFSLSRYENNGILADAPWCTQDVWVILSQPIHMSVINQCDIQLGLPGCELRFSEILFNIGFSVFNPCLDIRNIHLHSNPSSHLDENRMYGSYLFTPACTIEDIRSGNKNILPSLQYLTNFGRGVITVQ